MCASKGNKSNNVGTTTPIITKMCAPFRNCTENSSSIGHWTKSVSKAAKFPSPIWLLLIDSGYVLEGDGVP